MDEGNEGDMTTIDVEVKGLIELQAKMEQMVADLHGPPVLNAMRDSALMVERDAKINAPVDTGRLRASIVPEIVAGADQIWGIVGSNVTYAASVEYGSRPHMPPIEPLAAWVRRHHIGEAGYEYGIAMLIAWKIAAHGTKARPYLEPAFQKNEAAIRNKFDQAIEVIVNK